MAGKLVKVSVGKIDDQPNSYVAGNYQYDKLTLINKIRITDPKLVLVYTALCTALYTVYNTMYTLRLPEAVNKNTGLVEDDI